MQAPQNVFSFYRGVGGDGKGDKLPEKLGGALRDIDQYCEGIGLDYRLAKPSYFVAVAAGATQQGAT